MKFDGNDKEKSNNKQDDTNTVERLRNLMQKNKSAALGLAVFLTLSTALTGCGTRNVDEEEEEDESYYVGGSSGGYSGGYHGSYYYVRGGTYKEGSWGKSGTIGGSGGYSSPRGGSVGA